MRVSPGQSRWRESLLDVAVTLMSIAGVGVVSLGVLSAVCVVQYNGKYEHRFPIVIVFWDTNLTLGCWTDGVPGAVGAISYREGPILRVCTWSLLRRGNPQYRARYTIVPMWIYAPTVLLVPGWLAWRRIARRFSRLSYPACECCEYNLTGNTSGVCPECGTRLPSIVAGKAERTESERETDE